MNALTTPEIRILDATGAVMGVSCVLFLMSLVQQQEKGRKLDIIYDISDCTFTIHRDTILTCLDEAPDHVAWDKMHTIWEQMETRGIDFLEVKIA